MTCERSPIGTAVVLLLLATRPLAAGAPSRAEPLALWDDPQFQRRFLGSYGVQAEVEPRVTAVEREQLEKLMPLMGSDPDEAARQLDQLTRPESSAALDFYLGNLHFQQGRLDQAAARYEAALAKFPSFLRAQKNLGLIRVRTARFDDAVGSLSRVIELGASDGLTYGLLGYSYAALGKFVSAESAYRSAMLLEPERMDWKLGLAQSVLEQHKYGEAVSLCEELIAREPERAGLWLLQANAAIGLGRTLEAAQNFEIVERLGGSTPRSLQTLGDIYVNEQLWELAERAYARRVELEGAAGAAELLRNVEMLAQRGALPQAQRLLDAYRGLPPGGLDDEARRRALKLEARIAVAGGEDAAAAGVLEQVVALDPLDGEALILLGRHHARAGDHERAVFYYERAEGLEGHEADARLRHAELLVKQARYAEAVPLLKRAQELKPRDEIGRYLEQVERVARAQR